MLRHELMKVATLRSTWIGSAVALAVSLLLAQVTARALGAMPAGSVGSPTELVQIVLRTSTPSLVAAAVLGVSSIRGEVRDGVLRMSLLRCPDRDELLRAKVATLAVVAGTLGAGCALAGILSVQLGAGLGAVPVSTWLLGVLAHVLLAVGWAWVGLAAGVVIPHFAGAVAGVLAVPFILEPALGAVLGEGAAALPFRSGSWLYTWLGGTTSFDGAGSQLAAMPFGALLVVVAVLSLHCFRRLEL
jgi:hypothetical protein